MTGMVAPYPSAPAARRPGGRMLGLGVPEDERSVAIERAVSLTCDRIDPLGTKHRARTSAQPGDGRTPNSHCMAVLSSGGHWGSCSGPHGEAHDANEAEVFEAWA